MTYTTTDGSGANDTSTLSIAVTPVNDDFTDADELFTIAEDSGTLWNTVLTGTSSVDGPVTVADFTVGGTTYTPGTTVNLTEGDLTINADGSFTFVPAANFNGSVPAVTYTTTDGSGTNDTSTLSITVTPVNDDFTDADESFTIAEDSGTLSNTVLSGTSSVDGPVTVADFTVGGTTYTPGTTVNLTEGDLTINADGSFTFVPAANFNGSVPAVTYTTTDGSGTDDTSTLTITVTPVNDDFTDADESFTIAEDSGTLSNTVLTGTSSVDGPVTVADFTVGGTTYTPGTTVNLTEGDLTINADGSFTFVPAANFNGAVPAVTYTTTDGSGTDDTSTLSITVTPVNDDFTDADESFTIAEDSGTLSNTVLSGTSSVDGPVTVADFTVGGTTYTPGTTVNLTEGDLTINADGSFTFAPAANFNGSVPAVTYTTTDGSGTDDTSTLSASR